MQHYKSGSDKRFVIDNKYNVYSASLSNSIIKLFLLCVVRIWETIKNNKNKLLSQNVFFSSHFKWVKKKSKKNTPPGC